MTQLERDDLACARFGVEVFRGTGHGAQLGGVRQEAQDQGADLVIVRCEASDWEGHHALERSGALLMDSHLTFERETAPLPADGDGEIVVRPATEDDRDEVARIARASFSDYGGHFHADPRLAPRATEVYVDWATRALTDPTVAAGVLAAEDAEGTVVGFATLRIDDGVAVALLDGVAPEGRGRGVHRLLSRARIADAHDRGLARIIWRTHLVNLAARRALIRHGFLPTAQEHTFHLWVDDQGRASTDADASS